MNPVSWRYGDMNRVAGSWEGRVGDREVATVHRPSKDGNVVWWTWDEDGVGGENGIDADTVTALQEAQAAVLRMLEAERGEFGGG